jgi:hypothetical protein
MTDADDSEDLDQLIVEFSRPGRADLAARVSGCYFIDVSDLRGFPGLPPHRKILVMSLLLCLKDRAGELRFEPRIDDSGEPGLRMSYVVDGVSYELVPPPSHLAPQIGRELKRLAGWLSLRGRIGGLLRSLATRIDGQSTGAASGLFRVGAGAGGPMSDVRVTVSPSAGGDRILLAISEVDPALSQIAGTSLRRLFEDRRLGRRASSGRVPDIT